VDHAIDCAAEALAGAGALVVGAGAGMGVDSGLPDFRGTQGFWRAYPPYAALGLSFEELANPHWFDADPPLAWGFYGHRLNLYRATRPHAGFAGLLRIAQRMPHGAFVYTSNVDGQFQRAGFDPDRVVECHGAIDAIQCLGGCDGIFLAPQAEVSIDAATFRAAPPLPACPRCGGLARPNILMFGDGGWDHARTAAQTRRFESWLESVRAAAVPLAIVELGAGTAVPSVRFTCEHLARRPGTTLIRVNPREPEGPPGTISIAAGARETVEKIERMLIR
jgi:NAD-dependent SIR2 family protein deacetylase